MTEHVFRATDSDSAMDKAIRELGEDAMILSVKRIGEMTEVRAMKESLVSVRLRPEPAAPSLLRDVPAQPITLSGALRKAEERRREDRENAEPAGPAEFLDTAETVLTEQPSAPRITLDLDAPAELDLPPAPAFPSFSSAQLVSPPEPVPAPVSERPTAHIKSTATLAPYTSSETATPDPVGAPMTALTLPQWTAPTPNDPAPDIPTFSTPTLANPREDSTLETGTRPHLLARNGFPPDIVSASTTLDFINAPHKQRDQACALLAQRLALPTHADGPFSDDIVFVFGPPGSGKTTAAARIAFEVIQTSAERPVLVNLRPDGFVEDGKLARHAQLLNISVNAEVPGQGRCIVDCSYAAPQQITEALSAVKDRRRNANLAAVLTLPSTWSARAVAQLCSQFRSLAPRIVLTHTHVAGLTPAAAYAMSKERCRIFAAIRSTRICDGLAQLDEAALAKLLTEGFDMNA